MNQRPQKAITYNVPTENIHNKKVAAEENYIERPLRAGPFWWVLPQLHTDTGAAVTAKLDILPWAGSLISLGSLMQIKCTSFAHDMDASHSPEVSDGGGSEVQAKQFHIFLFQYVDNS